MDIVLLMEAFGSDAPVAFLWSVTETLMIADDVRKGEELPPERLTTLLMNTLCSLAANPFYMAYAQQLVPMIQQAVLRFSMNTGEKPQRMVSDLACYVAFLCGGPEHAAEYAPKLRSMFYAD